jgi:type I restriction enzyme S subunit
MSAARGKSPGGRFPTATAAAKPSRGRPPRRQEHLTTAGRETPIRFSDRLLLGEARINGYLGELCESIASRQMDTAAKLSDLCYQVNDKKPYADAVLQSYVSTESLLVNKGGRQTASSLPSSGKVTQYKVGDTLVSNIRPYFKKVWFADQDGTCSGDVIVFRAREAQNAPYVYSLLRTDSFFDWVMRGSKGTKMPRGDKKQMMAYPICPSCENADLSFLSSAVNKLCANERENERLSKVRDTLLPKLMSGEMNVSKVDATQPNSHFARC